MNDPSPVVPGDTATVGGDVRVWQRSDGRLAIRDEHGRYGSDVFWLGDMDEPPADALPLTAAPRAVAPVGNVDRDAVVQLAVDRYEAEYPNSTNVPLQWLRLGVDVALAALRGGEQS